jgi:serine/threonine-protein kinase
MGLVWSAKHEITQKRVALKILKVAGNDVRRRFLREARLASALRHPNVVDVHDVLELETGEPFMVMDLLEGEPLADRLERETALTLDETSRIALPVLSAVSAAHAMGIVHRDLKPENIFLSRPTAATPAETVQVLDFGIAKLTMVDGALSHTTGLTQTGSVLGTPTYMAPEQVFGEKSIDHRADVWALGVILYECLAGACPIEGENVGQIFKSISQHSFDPIEKRVTSLPKSVARVIDRMLSQDPRARPSLREVAEVLAGETGRSMPTIDETPVSRGDIDVTPGPMSRRTGPTAGATTMAAPSTKPRESGRLYGVGLAVLIACSFGAAMFVRQSHEANAPASSSLGSRSSDPVSRPSPLVDVQAPIASASAVASAMASSAPTKEVARPFPSSPSHSPSPGSAPPVAGSAATSNSATARSLGGVHVDSPY